MDKILEKLKSSRDQYIGALAGIPEERVGIRPASGGWSILDCAEHVSVVELGMFRRITSEFTILAAEPGRHREALFLARGLDRSRKFFAPEPAQPCGRFATLAAAASGFSGQRERTITWVESCGENLRLRSLEHPVFGTINAYECLILMALHPLRHLQQIRELV